MRLRTTPIKLEGEGAWNARKRGGAKRRFWRKAPLGIDGQMLEIRAVEVTTRDVGDAPMLPEQLDQIPADQGTASVTADGAYDTRKCHDARFVEWLILTGNADINGRENSLNNRLTGNAGNNVRSGGNGNDLLDGGRGHDVITGGAGSVLLFGGIGVDTLVFSAVEGGRDRVAGLAAWDTLRFDGFGYTDAAQALGHMTQVGTDVVFADQGVSMVFATTLLNEITTGMIDV